MFSNFFPLHISYLSTSLVNSYHLCMGLFLRLVLWSSSMICEINVENNQWDLNYSDSYKLY